MAAPNIVHAPLASLLKAPFPPPLDDAAATAVGRLCKLPLPLLLNNLLCAAAAMEDDGDDIDSDDRDDDDEKAPCRISKRLAGLNPRLLKDDAMVLPRPVSMIVVIDHQV